MKDGPSSGRKTRTERFTAEGAEKRIENKRGTGEKEGSPQNRSIHQYYRYFFQFTE
jgi:hypothetical protein